MSAVPADWHGKEVWIQFAGEDNGLIGIVESTTSIGVMLANARMRPDNPKTGGRVFLPWTSIQYMRDGDIDPTRL
jgi:hypothetical protein